MVEKHGLSESRFCLSFRFQSFHDSDGHKEPQTDIETSQATSNQKLTEIHDVLLLRDGSELKKIEMDFGI